MLLLAILLVPKLRYLHWEAAWFKDFKSFDDNAAINVPFFCLVHLLILDVIFVSTSLGLPLILYPSVSHFSSLLRLIPVFALSYGANWARDW